MKSNDQHTFSLNFFKYFIVLSHTNAYYNLLKSAFVHVRCTYLVYFGCTDRAIAGLKYDQSIQGQNNNLQINESQIIFSISLNVLSQNEWQRFGLLLKQGENILSLV